MKIFRVSCECYDRAWYVKTTNKTKALKLIREMTEARGWHLDYPEEPRRFECEERFQKVGYIIEDIDL